ncbi:MAG TPA: hypothetical protein VKB79_20740 [Bryobacteraceae bacterium]|nr:hypothetical protein [Bryobacteraceae bacterium]
MNLRKHVSTVALAALTLGLAGGAFAGSGYVYTESAANKQMKNLVIEPGADPSAVQLHFDGAERVTFGAVTGDLDIFGRDGSVRHYHPRAYQTVNGKRKPVVVGYEFVGTDRVTLKIQHYDPSAPVVITPVTGPGKSSM